MLRMGSHSCQQTWQHEGSSSCPNVATQAVGDGKDLQNPGACCCYREPFNIPGQSLQAGSLAKAHLPQHRGSLGVCGGVATLKLVNIKLALAAGVVHVANLPEDGPLCPALVVDATDGPQAACQAQGHKCQLSLLLRGTQRTSGMWVQSRIDWSCLQRSPTAALAITAKASHPVP